MLMYKYNTKKASRCVKEKVYLEINIENTKFGREKQMGK